MDSKGYPMLVIIMLKLRDKNTKRPPIFSKMNEAEDLAAERVARLDKLG